MQFPAMVSCIHLPLLIACLWLLLYIGQSLWKWAQLDQPQICVNWQTLYLAVCEFAIIVRGYLIFGILFLHIVTGCTAINSSQVFQLRHGSNIKTGIMTQFVPWIVPIMVLTWNLKCISYLVTVKPITVTLFDNYIPKWQILIECWKITECCFIRGSHSNWRCF